MMANLSQILNRCTAHFRQEKPFVIYAKPEETAVTAFLQNNTEVYLANDFAETGFVFASFDGEKNILIPESGSEILTSGFLPDKTFPAANLSGDFTNGRDHFENLVAQGIQVITSGDFQKLVLSRKETVKKPDFDFAAIFEKLLQVYPGAFRYCWFHPEIGFWMGATPEKLLKTEGNKFYTMALAGTQKNQGLAQTDWPEKEKQEQQFVTDFIVESLQGITSEIHVSEPYTAKAGNLLHIKTDINGTFNGNSDLKEIIGILHPTPAVCGLPKKKAQQFIVENEGYDREYYSGFLGELNRKPNGISTSDLYVNLRCMQITGNSVQLYMGCGITKDSNPEKEYIETVSKSMTMKNILWK